MSGSLSPSGSGVSLVQPLRLLATYNVTEYGAALNGTTDDAGAITTAMAAASAAGGGVVVVPGAARCASGLTVPNGVILSGAMGLAGASPGPSKLTFDLSVATCVTVGNGTTGAAGLRNIFITRAAGTIPAASKGVYVFGGYNPLVEYVVSQRHDICFQFSANGLTGGISAHVDHLYSGVAQDAHLVVDGWPEFYCSNSRFGSNGAADLTCNAYVRVTGGVVGGGPNGLNFAQCQFNQGINNAAALLEFKNFTATGGVVAQEWGFTGCHAEQCLAGIKSDAGTSIIPRLTLSQLFWNTTNPFLALNAATQIDHWTISNCQFYGAFTLAPSAQINFLTMSGNTFNAAMSITSPAASNSVATLFGNTYVGTLTLAGPWASLQSMDAVIGAASITATGALDYRPADGVSSRTYGETIGGVSVAVQPLVTVVTNAMSPYTYTKRATSTVVQALVVGGGGGGGFGGAYNPGATGGSGGGGGGAGGQDFGIFPASFFSASESITVGAGGAGGTSGVTPAGGSIAGQGARGGVSSIGTKLYGQNGAGGAPGQLGVAAGGGAGGGSSSGVNSGFGTTAQGSGPFGGASGGTIAANNANAGTGGGQSSALGAASPGANAWTTACGGSAGGGFNASAVAQNGGTGTATLLHGTTLVATAGVANTGTAAGNGGGNTSSDIQPPYTRAAGGAGGGAGSSTDGGAGGAGGGFGGGGGGGGAGDFSLGRAGGNGGAGAPGVVVIIEW